MGSKGNGYTHLKLILKSGEILFCIKNPMLEKGESWKKHPGIGLDNVKKRLLMLYPDRHRLDISDSEGIFKVDLKVRLEE
jgi:LytS/YehU family sensor histidine kinase